MVKFFLCQQPSIFLNTAAILFFFLGRGRIESIQSCPEQLILLYQQLFLFQLICIHSDDRISD